MMAIVVVLAGCGGGSASPTTTPAIAAVETPRPAPSVVGGAGRTAAPAQASPGSGSTQVAASTASETPNSGGADSAVPGTTALVPPTQNVTVAANGTATNPQGTPVVLPTTSPASTGGATATVGTQSAGVTSGARIFIDAPAEVSDDFTVDVKVDGVTKPYVAFNVYVTFDPSVLEAIVIKAGTALAPTPDEMFCARVPPSAGAVGLGCTVLESSAAAANGVLATIKFRRLGTGTSQLHLRTVDEGGAATGTYISTLNGDADLRPDIVVLNDASVVVV